jgi:hypothetical protein
MASDLLTDFSQVHKFWRMESKNRPIRCFSGRRFRTKTTPNNGETPQRLGLSGVLQKVRECFLTLHMVELAGFEPASTSLFRTVLHV